MGIKNKVEVTTGDPAPKRRYEVKYKLKSAFGEAWASGTIQVFGRSQREAEEFAIAVIKDGKIEVCLDSCRDVTDECEGL